MSHAHPEHHSKDKQHVRVAVITVSDTRTRQDDDSGDLIASLTVAAGHTITARSIVRDETPAIRQAVEWLVSEELDVLITTGGTGIAERDVTYEVVRKMMDKRLDGFGEAFRRLSWDEIGPRSILSRAVAGIVGNTLVFVLPGSLKAVRLAMEQIVLPVLPHAVALTR